MIAKFTDEKPGVRELPGTKKAEPTEARPAVKAAEQKPAAPQPAQAVAEQPAEQS